MEEKNLKFFIKTGGKEHEVPVAHFNEDGGAPAYASAYKDATIRMRDKDNGDYDIPLVDYDKAVSSGLHPFTMERLHVQPKSTDTDILQAKQGSMPESMVIGEKTFNKADLLKTSDPIAPVSTTTVVKPKEQPHQVLDKKETYHKIEDAGINESFKKQPVKSYEDIKDRYADIFKSTEDGMQAQSDIDDATKGLIDIYSQDLYKSKAYKDIMASDAIPADKDKTLQALWKQKYEPLIEKDLQPYYNDYNEKMISRYGDSMNKRSKELEENNIGSSWDGIEARINEASKKQPNKSKLQINDLIKSPDYGNLKNDMSAKGSVSGRQLSAARSMVNESRKLIKAANDEKDGTFIGGVVRGTADQAFNLDNWTMGLKGLSDGDQILKVLNKADKGDKLTNEEQILMDAVVSNAATQAYYSSQLGRGYKAGQVTGASLPFMLDMMTGMAAIQGATRAASKGLLKYIAKEYGQNRIKNTIAKGITGFSKGIVDSAIHTATFGSARAGQNYIERGIGDIQTDVNKDGMPVYKGRTGKESGVKAFVKAGISQGLETQSELAGAQFAPMIGFVGKQITKLPGLNKIPFSKIGEYFGNSSGPAIKTIKDFASRTQFHGALGEYAEEVYNNIGSVAIGDMTPEQLTDLDQNIDTFLGVGVMSAAFGAAGTGAFIRDRFKTSEEIKSFEDKMKDSGIDFTALKRDLSDIDIEGARKFVKETIADTSLSPEERKEEFKYIANVLKDNAMEHAQGIPNDEDIEQDKSNIYVNFQRAQAKLAALPNDVQTLINDGNIESLDDQHKQTGIDFMAARQDFQNYINLVNKKVADAKEQAGEEVKSAINPDMQGVVSVNSHISPNPITIVKGKIDFDEDGSVIPDKSDETLYYMDENGTRKQVHISQITTLSDMIEAESFMADAEKNAADEVINNEEAQLPQEPQIGMQVTRDGIQGIVSRIDPDGIVVSTENSDVMIPMDKWYQTEEDVNDEQNIDDAKSDNVVVNEQQNEPSTQDEESKTIPIDKKGNPLYHLAPVEMTVEDITDGSLTPTEVDEYIVANKKDAERKLNSIKPPKIGVGNKQVYLQAKENYNKQIEEAQKVIDYWGDVENEIKSSREMPGDKAVQEIRAMGEPQNAEELAAQFLSGTKLLREDFLKHTGYGKGEVKKMFGMFASKDKGGIGLEKAGEDLMTLDREEGTNLFDQTDANAGLNAILNVLGQSRTRGDLINYVKNNRELQAEKEARAEREAAEDMVQTNYHMSLEDYESAEEKAIPLLQEKYNGFDIDNFNGDIADAIKKHEDGQRASETRVDDGSEILPGEEFIQAEGAEGSQGNEQLQNVSVEGGAQNGTLEENKQSVVPDTGLSNNEQQPDIPNEISKAEANVEQAPTDAQKEAGNYKKGHLKLDGYDISIENPKGSVRSGFDRYGKKWETPMNNTYGYIRGTKGVDGDHIDVFLSDDPTQGDVFVVDQINPDGTFDEHKVMYGFNSEDESKQAYLSNYAKGWKGLGNITQVSKEQFKNWIDSSHRKTKPFAEYKNFSDGNLVKEPSKDFEVQKNNDNIVSESRGNEKSYKTKDGEQLSFTFLQEESDKAFSTRQGSGEIRQENPLLGTKYLGRLKDGEFCKVERIFTKSKSFSFTSGETIETPEDIAYIFKNLEDSSIENSFAVFVKDGTPTVIHLGMGNFTSTTVTIPSIIAANNRINADQIYFVHNHPSGTLKASGEDINIYKKLKSIFKEKLQDAIIINLKSGKFAQFNDLNSSESMRRNPLKKVALTLYSFDKQVFAKDFDPSFLYQVRSANDIAGFISSHRLGYREKMSALILNNQLNVMGNVFLPYTSITKDNVEEITKEISEKVTALGGNRCVLYGRFAIDNTFNISEFASNFYINIVDVFDVRTNKSALDNDTLSEGIEDYENNIANEDGYSQALQDQQYFESNFNHCPILTIRSREDAYEQAKTLGMTDADAKEIKVLANDVEYAAVYIPEYKRMFIFADKGSNFRSSMFHENMHWAIDELFRNREDDFNTLYVSLYNSRPEDCDKIRELYEGESEFVKRNEVIANIAEVAFEKNKMNIVLDKIDGKGRSIFNEILNYIGYETEESTRGRISDNSRTYREDESGRQSMPNEGENSQESRGRESVEREIGETVDEIAKILNTPVEIIRDVNEIKDDNKKRELRKRRAKGWFDPSTGKVTIVIPNAADEADVQATMLHEIVAHKGLKEMLGDDNFNELCNNVYNALPKDVQERLYAKYKSETIAGDEYMASIAEEGCSPTLWEKIKGFVKNAFRKLSIDLKISDNDIKYLLWKSKNRLMKGDSEIDVINKVAKDSEQKDILFSSSFGGNRGYVGYSISKRGYRAKEEGKYPKTEFKREYEINDKTFKTLSDVGIISGNEWHHTSMYGNKTTFYKWDDESYFDTYDANKSKINSLVKSIGKQPQMGDITTSEEMQEYIRQFDEWTKKRNKIKEQISDIFYDALDDANNDIKYREVTDENLINKLEEEQNFSDGSREAYNKAVDRTAFRARESYQDSMLALKVLQDVIEKISGKKIQNFENAYDMENRMSSISTNDKREFYDKCYEPMEKEISKLMAVGHSYDNIKVYVMAKHGLERNEVFARRDAEKKADAEYDDAVKKLNNISGITKEKHDEMAAELAANHAKSIVKYYQDNREKDYSGLTSLMANEGEKIDSTEAEVRAQQFVSEFEKKTPTYNLWNKINKATKSTLRKSYESGLMSKDMYSNMSEMFEFYIPLRGWNETTAEDVYEYLQSETSPVNSVIKSANGRKSVADDPFATIGSMAESTILQGNRNIMKQSFLSMVVNHPTDVAQLKKVWYVYNPVTKLWEISMPTIEEDDTPEVIEEKFRLHEESMKILKEQELATQKSNKLEIDYKSLKRQNREHMVLVKRNGEDIAILINGNPRAAQAVNGMTNPEIESNPFLKAVFATNRWLSANFTTRNPAFVLSNLSRDLIFASTAVAMKEDTEYAIIFAANITKAMKIITKCLKGGYDADFDAFIRNGGETGYMSLTDVDGYKKQLKADLAKLNGEQSKAKTALKFCIDRLEDFNRWAENVSRFTTYLTSRDMGKSVSESVKDAKEITVNFNKKGAGLRSYNSHKSFYSIENLLVLSSGAMRAFYVFFNAGIQGLVNIGRIAKEHPAKLASALGVYTLAGFAMPLINEVIYSLCGGGDDDPYADLPDWVKRNNICIYCGDGKFVTIPLPIELRAFYGLGSILYDFATNPNISGGELAYGAANQFTDLLPLNPIGGNGDMVSNFMPSVLKPLWEVKDNKDFTGKPVFKETAFNELDPEFKRVYKGTSGWLVDTSKFLNSISGGNDFKKGVIDFNPAKIEHLVQTYLGGLGTTLNQTAKTVYYGGKSLYEGEEDDNLVLRNIPVVNRFLNQTDEKSAYAGVNKDYRKLVDDYEVMDHEVNGLTKKASWMVPEYVEEYNKLVKTDEFRKYKEFEQYKNNIDKMMKFRSSLPDEETQKKIDEVIIKAKLEAVKAMENGNIAN